MWKSLRCRLGWHRWIVETPPLTLLVLDPYRWCPRCNGVEGES